MAAHFSLPFLSRKAEVTIPTVAAPRRHSRLHGFFFADASDQAMNGSELPVPMAC